MSTSDAPHGPGLAQRPAEAEGTIQTLLSGQIGAYPQALAERLQRQVPDSGALQPLAAIGTENERRP